jgi:hypothetical protein
LSKYHGLRVALVTVCALVAGSAAANGEGKGHPCMAVKQACEAAGYAKGGHANGGKGLFKDCMMPLLNGQPVTGVTVAAAELEACKAKKSAHH